MITFACVCTLDKSITSLSVALLVLNDWTSNNSKGYSKYPRDHEEMAGSILKTEGDQKNIEMLTALIGHNAYIQETKLNVCTRSINLRCTLMYFFNVGTLPTLKNTLGQIQHFIIPTK